MLARLLSRMDRTGIDSVVVALREGGSLAQELRGNGITVHFADLSSVPRAPARLEPPRGFAGEAHAGRHCDITVEIREMRRDLYLKAVPPPAPARG